MPAVVIPDVMPDIRAWLRAHPLLTPFHAGRVFFRIPDPQRISGWPFQRIYRLDGAILSGGGDTPIYGIGVSIECWHNEQKGYNTVRQLAVATESALWSLDPGTLINPAGTSVAMAASAVNTIDSPDPDSGWPRLIVDSRWTFKPL